MEDKAAVKVEENRVDAADLSQLSARERNRLKSKQKRAARDVAEGAAAAAPASKKAKKAARMRRSPRLRLPRRRRRLPRLRLAQAVTRPATAAYSLFAARWEERHGAAALSGDPQASRGRRGRS